MRARRRGDRLRATLNLLPEQTLCFSFAAEAVYGFYAMAKPKKRLEINAKQRPLTVKDRAIEIQGDQAGKIRAILEAEGFQVAGVK